MDRVLWLSDAGVILGGSRFTETAADGVPLEVIIDNEDQTGHAVRLSM
jgi:hypothetical protein